MGLTSDCSRADRERLEQTKRDVEKEGGRAIVVEGDVSDPGKVEAAAIETEKAFGPIDRDEVPHNFPKPHTDVLEQFVDYRVPVDRISDLARYDGSVIVERTKGEVSARCDMEEMNYLALNLMHEIATGHRAVDDARRTYAETATAFMMRKGSSYTDGLQFESRRDDTADVDEMTITPMMKSAAEQAANALRGGERS